MKKIIVIFLCAIIMIGCRSKKTVVQDQYRIEVKDSTVKRETKKTIEVMGTDTSKIDSQVEEFMVFHFTDSGGRVEVLPDGSLRMQGITTANGVIRGQTKEEKGISNKTKTDDVYLDSTSKNGNLQEYSHKKEKKQPPNYNLAIVLALIILGLVLGIVTYRGKFIG